MIVTESWARVDCPFTSWTVQFAQYVRVVPDGCPLIFSVDVEAVPEHVDPPIGALQLYV
jgi:hypothetical protein